MNRSSPGQDYVVQTSPLHGLPRRQMPFIPVFAQSIAAVAPSGCASVIPLLMLSTTGGGAALVGFVCAIAVILLVSACLRPMAQRMAAVGGIYSFTARGLGPEVAVPTGWSALVGYAAVSMAGLLAVGTYLAHIAVASGLAPTTSTTAIVGIVLVAAALATVVMVRGIAVSAWITLLIECVSIALVGAVLVLLVVRNDHSPHAISAAMEWGNSWHGIKFNIVVAVAAFVGFESSTTLSREAKRPFLTIPRTLRWTPVAVAVLYLFAVPIQAIAMSSAPAAVRDSAAPLAELLAHNGSTALSTVLDLGIAASFFACTLASVNALVRVLICMGREGVAPARLGRTHLRFQTPAPAVVTAMALITIGPLGVLLTGISPDQGLLAFLTLSGCGYLGSYLAGCAAAPVLLRRIGESTRGVWITSGVATSALLILLLSVSYVAVRDHAIPLVAYGIIMCAAVCYTFVLKRFAPHRLAAVGIYDETEWNDLSKTGLFR
ncbi:APC family permease [Saccharopolyspora mangrovi]|uniref:APC family permease n=1 Tax=Saccharopolyspora mangrovi TaxID=3082379 RepID=A0ABU6AEZ2_9PSEU|nr:APC family permease [Saccharopolyspora sp. S2-29]MEB3370120.1 APC family permease [Saccharopolyspora sp. S2-29]